MLIIITETPTTKTTHKPTTKEKRIIQALFNAYHQYTSIFYFSSDLLGADYFPLCDSVIENYNKKILDIKTKYKLTDEETHIYLKMAILRWEEENTY